MLELIRTSDELKGKYRPKIILTLFSAITDELDEKESNVNEKVRTDSEHL